MSKEPTKRSARHSDDANELRAGVSAEQEKEIGKLSAENADDLVVAEDVAETATAASVTTPDGIAPDNIILKDLPENGAVVSGAKGTTGTADEQYAAAITQDVPTANHYSDEFVGQGGSFIIDADTGERKRVYTEILDDDGKVSGYRPAV